MPRQRATPLERIIRAVDVMETGFDTPCWVYSGHVETTGYCRIRFSGQRDYAHRIAYEGLVGPIPEGLHIDHLCRITNCVNPEHLEAVTPAENTRRGSTPGARARRTNRCYRGHENWSKWFPSGQRHCLTCTEERARRKAEATV